MTKRLFYIVSLLIVASMVLTACGGAGAGGSAATGPIKVAILAPLSGPVPTFGVSTRDGSLMAIEEWNAKGGVLGKKIELVPGDDQAEPRQAGAVVTTAETAIFDLLHQAGTPEFKAVSPLVK